MEVSCTQHCSNKIYHLNSKVLSKDILFKLRNMLDKQPKTSRIALNLECVESVCCEFFELLKDFSADKKLSLINIESDIFVLLNLTKHDRFADIFMDESDFVESKGPVVNRRFSLLGNF